MYRHKSPIYLCAPKRTAIGCFAGSLASLSAPQLGAQIIKAVLEESSVPLDSINEVIMGCVLQAGTGQAPARQAALGSGLPRSVQAMTINKVCSSGLKAVMLAANSIETGQAEAIVAGGMESMSRAPFYLPGMRDGVRLGHTQAEDSIIKDGLWDVYNNQHMGNCAELCAREYKLSREAQDAFALQSYERANQAIAKGLFKAEIAPVTISNPKGDIQVDQDEEPGRLRADKVPGLRPVFDKQGTVTAANASSINDGAAAMLVCSESYLKKHGLKPVARILSQGWHAQEPEWFTTAPVGAVQNALSALGKKTSDIDLYEINEAFAAVALACQSSLEIPDAKLNITGGAVALGHPIGASGARILVTLLHALKREGLSTGCASLCNGGGEATALVVEVC